MLSMLFRKPAPLPSADEALPGRADYAFHVPEFHAVNGNRIQAPFPADLEEVVFGLGCFWGAERIFWQLPGVYATAVGYAAGLTPYPTYKEVCSGQTGHNEVVKVIFDPKLISFEQLVQKFFESHDPTQGMRQGNDVGTQYRSGIYVANDSQNKSAQSVKARYQQALTSKKFGDVTTEIVEAPEFYYAEDYHQQYLAKNPMGYCGLGGTGVSCPSGVETH